MTTSFNSQQGSPVATQTERLPEPLVDTNPDGNTYLGDAILGTGETEPRWRIRRRRTQGTVQRTDYPQGSDSFSFSWSDRLTYTYGR